MPSQISQIDGIEDIVSLMSYQIHETSWYQDNDLELGETKGKKEMKGTSARTYLTSCIKDVEEDILPIYIHMVLVPTLCNSFLQIEQLCYTRISRFSYAIVHFFRVYIASSKQEGGLGEFHTFMQT